MSQHVSDLSVGRESSDDSAVPSSAEAAAPHPRYDAFLSYANADREYVAAIHTAMRRLVALPWQRSKLRIFRDDTNLAATPNLWPTFARALDNSAHLVVVASPAAVGSQYVNQEITHFLSQPPRRPIYLVLIEGTLEWDRDAGGFDAARSTAAIPALDGAFEAEPLVLDLRQTSGSTLAAPVFRRNIARLCAPLLGTTVEELDDADWLTQRRALRLIRGAAALLAAILVAAVVAGLLAATNPRQAREGDPLDRVGSRRLVPSAAAEQCRPPRGHGHPRPVAGEFHRHSPGPVAPPPDGCHGGRAEPRPGPGHGSDQPVRPDSPGREPVVGVEDRRRPVDHRPPAPTCGDVHATAPPTTGGVPLSEAMGKAAGPDAHHPLPEPHRTPACSFRP
jgi:hypothetical protein